MRNLTFVHVLSIIVDNFMSIQDHLQVFGLSQQERNVYMLLVQSGWSTVVQLAKNCPIKRPTLYRILESLIHTGLVVTRVGEKTTYYRITSAESFESLILESETKTRQMRESMETIKRYTENLSNVTLTETSVLYYKGIRGLKQMEWIIRGRKPYSEVLVFDSLKWNDVLGSDFTEELRQLNVDRNVYLRSLSNSEDPIRPDGTTSWTTNKKYTLKYYRHRLIDRNILNIQQDIFVTSDSIVFYGVKPGDEVAIHIANAEYAAMMRQLFEYMWDKAKVIDHLGQRFSS